MTMSRVLWELAVSYCLSQLNEVIRGERKGAAKVGTIRQRKRWLMLRCPYRPLQGAMIGTGAAANTLAIVEMPYSHWGKPVGQGGS